MRRFNKLRRDGGLLALSLILVALPCAAQTYPAKPVRVIVGFAPGGATDIIARMISPRLTAALGQSFVVENRGGADSLIASELVARAEPDGHLIYFISSAHTVNPSLYKNVHFDANKDFSAITMVGDVPNVVVVHPALPVHSMREFVDLAKKKKGELHFASSASITFLGTALLNKMAGIDTVRLAYKGAGPAMIALMSGEAQFMLTGIGPVLPHINNGKVRPLAVSVMKRSPLLPNIPTIHESAVPGYLSSVWYAALAPARVPRPIIDRLNSEMRKIMAEPDIKAGLVAQAIELAPSTPEELQEYMRTEIEKWAKVVKESGAKIE
ncbi:MAG TPA: tripartite tricarboxylate transporter substrate binding protein [Burkholderiales bacterium]|nr:tripartite tricarboxylate transporter substrate binding protein [Burkholderiales bacterium]